MISEANKCRSNLIGFVRCEKIQTDEVRLIELDYNNFFKSVKINLFTMKEQKGNIK